MTDRRIRILCPTMKVGMRHLAARGLKSLDPRWCFIHRPSGLDHALPGSPVVDLTHLERPTRDMQRLQHLAQLRGHPLVTVEHLKTLEPYWPGRTPG